MDHSKKNTSPPLTEQQPYRVTYVRMNATTVKATLNSSASDIKSSSVSKNKKDMVPIVVFDASGSMNQYGRFQKCRALVESLIASCGKVELIVYNRTASYFGCINRFPSNLEADGQTWFGAAYDELLRRIRSSSSTRHDVPEADAMGAIVFMSDGEDNVSGNTNKEYLGFKTSLQALCKELRLAYAIHAVGVDAAEADAQLLVNLSRAGTVEGTFGAFASNSSSSSSSSSNHDPEAKRLVSTILGSANATIVSFRGKTYALTSDQPVVHVFFHDQSMDCSEGGEATVYDEIDFAAFKLGEMASDMANVAVADVCKLRDQIYGIFAAAGKPPFSREERKSIRQKLEPLNELMRRIYEAIHANGNGGRTLSNAVISSLNIAAREARSTNNTRFVRTAVDRSDKNAVIMEQEDKAIEALVQQKLLLTLGESTTLEAMTCTLTQCSAKELLEEGDCIGIGVRANAAEVCMFDPTRLEVLGIGACFFAASEFLVMANHVKHDLSFRPGDDGAVATTSVIKDATGIEVSGVLPLYINEAHWSIARHHVRRMASHLCCKDPLMGNGPIVFFTYIQVYNYLLEHTQGEKWHATTALFRETIKFIYAEYHSVIPKPQSFIDKVGCRLASVVLSPTALVSAYEALGLEFDAPKINLYVAEEMMRRAWGPKDPLSIGEFFMLDRGLLIDPYVREQVKDARTGQASPIASKMARLLESVAKADDPPHPPQVLELLHSALGKMVRGEYEVDEATGELIDYGEPYDPLLAADFVPPSPVLPAALKSLMVDANMSLYSWERQALVLLQISSRRNEADYTANYRDWHTATETEVRDAFTKRCVDHIRAERVSAVGKIVSALRDDETSIAVAHLLQAQLDGSSAASLLERVALMHGTCFIGRNVTPFSTTVSSLEEQRMLYEGEYDIAPLIGYKGGPVMVRTLMDGAAVGRLHRWIPSASNQRRIHNQFK